MQGLVVESDRLNPLRLQLRTLESFKTSNK